MQILKWLGGRELSVLVALVAVMASLWIFAEIADEVMEGSTKDFDHTVLLSLRSASDIGDPIGPRWVEEIGRDLTALGGNAVLTLFTLMIVGYLILIDKQRVAVVVIVATLGALIVSSALKRGFDRDRPDLVPHGSVVYTSSFPSAHSMLAASTYLTLGALLARIQRRRRVKAYILLSALSLTVLVGVSRVYLGVHWPTDVFAGWTAGAGWALLCWLLARWLQRAGALEQSSGAIEAHSGVKEQQLAARKTGNGATD